MIGNGRAPVSAGQRRDEREAPASAVPPLTFAESEGGQLVCLYFPAQCDLGISDI